MHFENVANFNVVHMLFCYVLVLLFRYFSFFMNSEILVWINNSVFLSFLSQCFIALN